MSDKRTDGWYDEEAGRLVPSYYLAGGRTNSSRAHLDISTQVKAADGYTTRTGLSPEQIAILDLCRQPLSVAELAAYLREPLLVVKVLLGDLVERGDVQLGEPVHVTDKPDRAVLQQVLEGLKAL